MKIGDPITGTTNCYVHCCLCFYSLLPSLMPSSSIPMMVVLHCHETGMQPLHCWQEAIWSPQVYSSLKLLLINFCVVVSPLLSHTLLSQQSSGFPDSELCCYADVTDDFISFCYISSTSSLAQGKHGVLIQSHPAFVPVVPISSHLVYWFLDFPEVSGMSGNTQS